MNTAYEASPECAERQCQIVRTYDIEYLRSVFQHGDNPEAVLFVDHVSCALDPAAAARHRFREWAERIHRYEESGPTERSHLTGPPI